MAPGRFKVDWVKCPVEKLAELWQSYQPQMNDYILRAVDPSQAPSYGVLRHLASKTVR